MIEKGGEEGGERVYLYSGCVTTLTPSVKFDGGYGARYWMKMRRVGALTSAGSLCDRFPYAP